MINLIEINQINDVLIQEFNLVRGDLLYECLLDKEKIGYAVVREKTNNKIFLVIREKYQNKGYGNVIFKLLLSKINDSVIVSVPFKNIKMQKIIQKNNGIEVGRNGLEIQYKIK